MNQSTCTSTSSIISTRYESFSIEIMGFSIILFLLILVGGLIQISFRFNLYIEFKPQGDLFEGRGLIVKNEL